MTKLTVSFGQRIRRILGVRLGRLYQFDPVPIQYFLPQDGVIAVHKWPSFTIVTPSYNQARFIKRTVDSVLQQQCPKLSYIVQDGGSNDGTEAVLRDIEHQDITIFIESDSGQADAINRGFTGATTDIMGYLNSDDILLPNTLATVANYFDNHPETDAVYGDRLLIDEADAVIGYWRLPYHDGLALKTVDYIPQETLFWRQRAWSAVGGKFDASLQFAMDWDFVLRLEKAGMRIDHIPKFLGAFRIHENQKTIAQGKRGKSEMRILRRRYSSAPTRLAAQFSHLSLLARHVALELSKSRRL